MVDDEAPFREIGRVILESNHYRVEEADNGEKGLQMAKELRPALILLDMKMPGWTGSDTIQKLRETEETKNIPVVFLTSFGDARVDFESDRHFAGEVGANDFVSKARLADDLLPRVNKILGK